MKKLLQNQKVRLYCKRITATACFLAIIAYVYASATYLFRGKSLNEFNDDRLGIVGIKEEDPLDMIYIGGSDVFCYFSPLQAWNDYGFTSYDLGSTSLQTENILYLLKHALKYQDAQLLVIGVRSFVFYSGDGEEGGLRYTSDALDLGIDRLRLIKTYYDRRPMEDDICSVYVDIAKHHSRYELLSSPEAWALMDNMGESPYKGADVKGSYYYLDELPQANTGGRRELAPMADYMLHELLDFCKDNELNVLFVESPYVLTQEEYELYNTIDDVVTSYGFRFLNANEYFEEMKLDVSQDFIDRAHVNVFGAEKYTDFLGNYIVENYGFSDHGVEGKASWDEAYAAYADMEKIAKTTVEDLIASVQEGEEIAGRLHETEDLAVWCDLADDPRFTILAIGDGDTLSQMPNREKEYLEEIGLANSEGNNLIRVLCNSKILYSNENNDESICTMSIGAQNNVRCVIDNANQALSIKINDEECSRKDKNGINIVVFQNDCRNIADSLTIQCNGSGGVELIR
ncbi:MAG: hypothetical protein J1E98_14645 [Lachnospiraceae bacterium]|nr:hypothetical protein [Lachnospiraceae bacterium]